MTKRVVEESIVVRASAAQIFDLLATPSKHPVIDGSSSVKATIEAPERLSLGAEFRMDMKIGDEGQDSAGPLPGKSIRAS